MHKLIFFTIICFLSVSCANNQASIEANYLGSKTTFEDIVSINDITVEDAWNLIVGALNQNKFIITHSDKNQKLLVAKKNFGSVNTYVTTSVYLFGKSDGVSMRVVSNTPKNSSANYDFHSRLLNSLISN